MIKIRGNNDVSTFYICDHEVTQKEWQSIMGYNPSVDEGDNNPVERIDWYEAVEYCNYLSQKQGLTPCYIIDKSREPYNNQFPDMNWTVTWNKAANGYRLPTEAEWSYAAKGGNKSKGYRYSGSDNIDDVAWYWNNSKKSTHEVKGKTANELGIYDMSGNVYEWCWNWYEEYLDNPNPKKDYSGPMEGKLRVFLGGSFECDANKCSFPCRMYFYPYSKDSSTGFRVVRSCK